MYILLEALLPFCMLLTAFLLYKFPPKSINSLAGYRTKRSMANSEAWKEANEYSMALFMKLSLLSLLVTVLLGFTFGCSEENIIAVVFISIAFILISLMLIIFLTEKRLKKMFDK